MFKRTRTRPHAHDFELTDVLQSTRDGRMLYIHECRCGMQEHYSTA